MSGAFPTLTPAPWLAKPAILSIVLCLVLGADLGTKAWVVRTVELHQAVPLLGDSVRLTYTHNPGALFGVHVGEDSRAFFLALTAGALLLLGLLYTVTPARHRLRLGALALVAAGALGNALDRLRYEQGVIDFVAVTLGGYRLPVFNLADLAVVGGAAVLVASLYPELLHIRPHTPQRS